MLPEVLDRLWDSSGSRDLSLPFLLFALCIPAHKKWGADFLNPRPLRGEGPGCQHDGIFSYPGSWHSGRQHWDPAGPCLSPPALSRPVAGGR